MTTEVYDSVDRADFGPPPTRHVPGEPGVWVLLFGDMLAFLAIFVVYLSRRAQDKEVFAASQDALNRSFGAINTIILLTSSLLVVFAVRAMSSDRQRRLAGRLALAGAAVGVCFVGVKALEYHELISAGITPNTNEFYMYYFALTGLHLVHVVIGLGVLLVMSRLAQAAEPFRTHISFFEGGGCFWHMVDLLWIVIFPLLVLVR